LRASEFLKTVEIDTPDPEFLLIGSNQATTQGVAFGVTGSSQTYMFNGYPFNPQAAGSGQTGAQGPTGPSSGVTGPTGATGMDGVASINPPAIASDNDVLTLVGSALNAQFATTARPGVLSAGAQTISGAKTFADPLVASQLTSSSNVVANYISLPTTTSATVGTIQQNSNRFVHTFGIANLFIGENAGNFTLSGNSNVGVGLNCLQGLNSSVGNCCLGVSSGKDITSGPLNTCLGNAAGYVVTTGVGNTLVGGNAALNLTTASNNIAIGLNSLPNNVSGDNIIEISDGTVGNAVAGDIRIGYSASTGCYVRGIAAVAPGGTPQMVIINPSTHKLGSQSIDNITTTNFTPTLDSGSILTSNVRGVGTNVLPITVTRVGAVVTMVIPAYQVLSESGAASSLNYTGISSLAAMFRPTYALSFPVTVLDAAAYVEAVVYVTAGGAVSMQLLTGANFIPTTGSNYDMAFSWNIAP
jgi:hypothetical protein